MQRSCILKQGSPNRPNNYHSILHSSISEYPEIAMVSYGLIDD